jgi:hypothetical protein
VTADDILNDPALQMLKDLSPVDIDRAQRERIRARCRTAFERRYRIDRVLSTPAVAVSQRVVEFGVVAVLCGLYLEEVLRRALALLG